MTFEFKLPDPGEGLTEAEIINWHIKEGDEVEEDDVLAEIETDKAVTEIPSPISGTIQRIIVEEGETVDVGTVIVVFENEEEGIQEQAEEENEIGEKEGEIEESEEAIAEIEKEAKEGVESEIREKRVFAAPSTRRYAREKSIDISEIDGSGPHGRVLREDIEGYTESEEEETASEIKALHPSIDIEPTTVNEDESRSERRDLSGLRGQIAENMTRSKTVTAHLTSGFEANAEALVALKNRLDEKYDPHITYTPILLKAVVPALKEFPRINASIDDTTAEIVEKYYYNIGFATHTDDGLMVPVIKDIDERSIVEVATKLNKLAEQARDRSIALENIQNGTFTVTNLALNGEHRTFGTPVINHPEAAIMGIGPIHEKPIVVDSEVKVRERIPLTLSYDHRLIDGVTANQFMEYVIEGIEDPDILLSRL